MVSTSVLGLTFVGVFGGNASASIKAETFNTGAVNFSLGANGGTDKSSAVKKQIKYNMVPQQYRVAISYVETMLKYGL